MITHFKSALNKIEAEEELVSRTEEYLRNALNESQEVKNVKVTKGSLFSLNKKLVVAFCLIFLFVTAGSTGAYSYYKTPVSYLSIDINPSVELGVNKFGKVVTVEGYNDDGKKILEGIDVTGVNVTGAVKLVIGSADSNGYIDSDGSTVIAVTSETDDPSIATKIQDAAEEGVNQVLEENGKTAVVYKENVPLSLNKEAKELGVTAGKLNLIKKLQEVDETATVEQYKDVSVKEIVRTIQDNKNGKSTNGNSLENKDEINQSNGDNTNQGNGDKTNQGNGDKTNQGNGNQNENNPGSEEKTNQGNVNQNSSRNGDNINQGNSNQNNSRNEGKTEQGNVNQNNQGNENQNNSENGNKTDEGNKNNSEHEDKIDKDNQEKNNTEKENDKGKGSENKDKDNSKNENNTDKDNDKKNKP